jgi:hypothetical protein
LLFDQSALRPPWWWPFRRRLRCPSCRALFDRQKDIDQPYKGPLSVGRPARRNYVVEIVLAVVSAVVAAVVLALLGLKG